MYHQGATLRSGHYVVVNVDAEGRFWLYDDRRASLLDAPVDEFRMHEVYVLVYTRVNGFWRYGPAIVDEAVAGEAGMGFRTLRRTRGLQGLVEMASM